MLTSKEVLERTGISRATLNNYIGSGLLPRPDVLPPTEGAAPRIGHFPDETVARIEEIQRLKQQGWSIGRIAQHFAGGGAPAPTAPPLRTPVAAGLADAPGPVGTTAATPSLADVPPAAYTADAALELLWWNDRSRSVPLVAWFGLRQAPAPGSSIVHALLAAPTGPARDALLAFHLQVARQRGTPSARLCTGLSAHDAANVQAVFHEALEVDPSAVLRTVFQGPGGQGTWAAYAIPMQHAATLFLYAPAAESAPAALVASGAAARAAAMPRTPELAEVAVLVAELQDAPRLWRQLPAHEYFELANEIALAVEPILRSRAGEQGRHPGDGLVAYFLARTDRDYLVQALAAAQDVREAMRRLSRQWQQRKGWTTQLCLNLGVAEGQEWIGSLRPSAPNEWTVLGDAAEQAALMARLGRGGVVWATRGLIGKLGPAQRGGLTYGAPRAGDAQEPLVLASFARLQDIAGTDAGRVPHEFADLAVAEVIALASPQSGPALPGVRTHHA